MLKYFWVLAITLALFNKVSAQNPIHRVISIPVIRNGITLREPWVGGVNAPQFSGCDLNGDGIKDLFVFDREGGVVLTYLSNGDGTDTMYQYAPQYEGIFPAGMSQYALIRDYNSDGIPDIFTFATTDLGAGIQVFKGSRTNGILHFDLVSPVINYTDSPYVIPVFTNYADIPVVTDVNGDGYLDILAYDEYGTFLAYYQNLTNLYPGNQHYNIDSFQYARVTTCWGNFSQNAGSNSVSLNVSCKGNVNPNPSGSPGNLRHAGNSIYNFRDPQNGTVDLLNGNIGYENLFYLQNCGDNVAANICSADSIYPLCDTPMIMLSYPAAFGVDVNNDGLEDLLISPNQTTVARDVNNVMYYKNTGNSSCLYSYQSDTFLTHNMLDFGTQSKGVFYDFNGDGLPDIIVGNYGYFVPSNPYRSTLAIYLNTGTTTQPQFTMQTEDYGSFSSFGLQGISPAFGDLNGDGKPDLLIGDASGNLSYFKNTGVTGSSFPAMTASQYFNLNAGLYAAPFIYDVNGDSLNDIILGNQNGTIAYYWNFGTKDSAVFSADSVNMGFGNINVTVSPNSVGYSQPYIRKDSAGNMLLYVGSLAGPVSEFLINPHQLRSGTFTQISGNFLQQNVGQYSTIAVADINNDGEMEYLVGNARGGLMMFSDSTWDPGTATVGVTNIAPRNNQLLVYPNPTRDYVICASDKIDFINAQTEVFNVIGELMNVETNQGNHKITINTNGLSNGFYVVRIAQGGEIFTGKILVGK